MSTTNERELKTANGELVFEDAEPVEVPVRIGNRRYMLCEASEDAACKYRNASTACARFDGGKMVGIQGPIADVEPLLVSLCLFELYDHQGETRRRPVTLTQVRSWPSRVVKPIYEKARELSRLKEDDEPEVLERRIATDQQRLAAIRAGTVDTAEGEAKNLPASTTDNSA